MLEFDHCLVIVYLCSCQLNLRHIGLTI